VQPRTGDLYRAVRRKGGKVLKNSPRKGGKVLKNLTPQGGKVLKNSSGKGPYVLRTDTERLKRKANAFGSGMAEPVVVTGDAHRGIVETATETAAAIVRRDVCATRWSVFSLT
jgi:hypothetical protein